MQNLSGFGCGMLCYDVKENPEAAKLGRYVSLTELYGRSDIINPPHPAAGFPPAL